MYRWRILAAGVSAVLALGQPRHGYCRGSEPHGYVRNIAGFYAAYVAVVPAEVGGD